MRLPRLDLSSGSKLTAGLVNIKRNLWKDQAVLGIEVKPVALGCRPFVGLPLSSPAAVVVITVTSRPDEARLAKCFPTASQNAAKP